MTHNLDPTHEKVAKTAWEKIHEHIMRCVGKQVVGAASLLDVLEIEEKDKEDASEHIQA